MLIVSALLLSACAVEFPRPSDPIASSGNADDGYLSGNAVFARSFQAHGGSELAALEDLNVTLDGRWKFLITRIQPLVTDHRYRVRSEERIAPAAGIYAALYRGPAGTKQVFRSPTEIRVWYDGVESTDEDVLTSTALTADAFQLFTLGPLARIAQVDMDDDSFASAGGYRRLPDVEEQGRRYHRIYRKLTPGLGLSSADELVFWIDAQSYRAYRVHITLEGFRTTRGAHVDVTFLDYEERAGLLLPVAFNERVRGPIAINAHRWQILGLDMNRGWDAQALQSSPWAEPAVRAAPPL